MKEISIGVKISIHSIVIQNFSLTLIFMVHKSSKDSQSHNCDASKIANDLCRQQAKMLEACKNSKFNDPEESILRCST